MPASLDTNVFRAPDDRSFWERRTYAHYNCTYPNDPKTLKDLHEEAHNRAKAGESDYSAPTIDNHIYRCDRCQPGGGGISGGGPSYAWFCAEEDDSRYVNFTRIAYGSTKPGQSCWIPDSALAGSVGGLQLQQQIGLEHGAIVEPFCYNRTRAFSPATPPGVNCYYPEPAISQRETGCSQNQQPDSCVLKKGYEKVCQCDENCNVKNPGHPDDCCMATKTIETLSVYYTWFECTIGDYGPQCGSSNKVV